MFRVYRRFRTPVMLAVFALAGLAIVPATAAADFQLGIQDPGLAVSGPSSAAAYNTVHQIGAKTIRIDVNWAAIAPVGAVEPAGFDASNPADPHYRWTTLDANIRAVGAQHLGVLIEIVGAPKWAQAPGEPASAVALGGPWDPSPSDFGQFMLALATRYSGTFPDPLAAGQSLPRVRSYEPWDEPNLTGTLQAPDVVSEYVALLNAAYGALKSVHPDNIVVAGSLAPVGSVAPVSGTGGAPSLGPLTFASQMLCLKQKGKHYVRTSPCPVKAHFDVLSIHPYTLTATPTTHAANHADTFVADVSKVHNLLQAAYKLRTAAPHKKYGLWVTEWAWFSNPPNAALGDPDPLAARYVAWSMYSMWHSGVSLVVWLLLHYIPGDLSGNPALYYGGALFTVSGAPTLKLDAFEFPVVAGVKRGKGFVWGRAPVGGRRSEVFVQHERGHRWRTIGKLRTGSDGVFEFHFKARGNGTYRARVKRGPTSLAYNSKPIRPKFDHLVPGLLGRDG